MQGQDWETYQVRKKVEKPKGANAADAARQKGMAVETHKKCMCLHQIHYHMVSVYLHFV